ncbi:hypothetical protein ABMA27_005208 [Loxostege sticticalis]|uniref:MADF domain-containing protein n=1 Tax=Loxostege sticticalis TaxID=481309 RepID=A0ABR3HM55_LOXSC
MEVVYKMNWSRSTVFKFIALYRKNRCLWDPQNENHRNRFMVRQSWERIQKELGMPCTITELKKKKESLMSAYRSYTTRIRRCQLEGKAWEPTWTYYETMDSFLGSVYTCNVSLQTAGEDNTDDEEEINDEDADESEDVKGPKIKKVVSLTTKKRHTHEQRRSNQLVNDSYSQPVDEFGITRSVDEAVTFTKPSHQLDDDDDECTTFGVLIAKKLRKLSDDRRDVMMVKINQLFVDEHNERNPSRTPHSTSSMFRDVSSPSTSFSDPLLAEIKPIARDRS